jgi:uncharacterized protein YndB with AHSA1/START domain
MPTVAEEKSVSTAASNLKLELTRFIRADRPRVFAAWTQPELMKRWMGPGKMFAGDVTADLRPGGHYRVEMKGWIDGPPDAASSPEDRVVTAHGTYQEIVPDERLTYTWNGSWDPTGETLVTVNFRDVPGGTEIRLTHERISADAAREGYKMGWTSTLDKLAKQLEY